MLWAGGPEEKEGGWASKQADLRLQESRGVRGIFGIFQDHSSLAQDAFLFLDLAELLDELWWREEKKGEHHALFPVSLVMRPVDEGVGYK